MLRERDHSDVRPLGDDWSGVSGADVVVLLGDVEPAVVPLTTHAPDAIVLVAGAPQGRRCADLLDATLFPRQRVIGVDAAQHAAALRRGVAAALHAAARDVTGLVVGSDGKGPVAVRSTLTLAGVSLEQHLGAERLDAVLAGVDLAADGGPLATALTVREIADAIVLDRHRVISVTACCRGELGVDKGAATVPVRIGRSGIEEIVELELLDAERAALG